AHFVANVRTRPLSARDQDSVRRWADVCAAELAQGEPEWLGAPGAINLPPPVETFMAGALARAVDMLPRRRAFAQCALLRLGQWALDCRDFAAPRRKRLARRLPDLVAEMLGGLEAFVDTCAASGVSKREIGRNRMLLYRN